MTPKEKILRLASKVLRKFQLSHKRISGKINSVGLLEEIVGLFWKGILQSLNCSKKIGKPCDLH